MSKTERVTKRWESAYQRRLVCHLLRADDRKASDFWYRAWRRAMQVAYAEEGERCQA